MGVDNYLHGWILFYGENMPACVPVCKKIHAVTSVICLHARHNVFDTPPAPSDFLALRLYVAKLRTRRQRRKMGKLRELSHKLIGDEEHGGVLMSHLKVRKWWWPIIYP